MTATRSTVSSTSSYESAIMLNRPGRFFVLTGRIQIGQCRNIYISSRQEVEPIGSLLAIRLLNKRRSHPSSSRCSKPASVLYDDSLDLSAMRRATGAEF